MIRTPGQGAALRRQLDELVVRAAKHQDIEADLAQMEELVSQQVPVLGDDEQAQAALVRRMTLLRIACQLPADLAPPGAVRTGSSRAGLSGAGLSGTGVAAVRVPPQGRR